MMGLEPRLLISAVIEESRVYIHKTIEVLMSIGIVGLLDVARVLVDTWLVCCTLVMMDRNV